MVRRYNHAESLFCENSGSKLGLQPLASGAL
jgi:hypothetical protein